MTRKRWSFEPARTLPNGRIDWDWVVQNRFLRGHPLAAVWGKTCASVALVDDPEAGLAASVLAGADEVVLGADAAEIRVDAESVRGSIAMGMKARLERLFLSAVGFPLTVTALPRERRPGEEG